MGCFQSITAVEFVVVPVPVDGDNYISPDNRMLVDGSLLLRIREVLLVGAAFKIFGDLVNGLRNDIEIWVCIIKGDVVLLTDYICTFVGIGRCSVIEIVCY